MKKIFFCKSHPLLHSSAKLMIENPPKGYSFILPTVSKTKKNVTYLIANLKIFKSFYQGIIKKILKNFDIYKSIYYTIPNFKYDLVYSTVPLNLKQNYILEIFDHPSAMIGYDYNLFINSKLALEKELLSPFCKKIMIANEASMKIMKNHFSKEVLRKCVLVRAAVKYKPLNKNYNKKHIQIIFIGSLTNPNDFYLKGGLEALESFKNVSNEFDVSLIVKCKVPKDIKKKYKNIKNLRIIEGYIEKEGWQEILNQSDICLNIAHVYPLMATLEAMNNGIPLIMLDSWGVRDYLEPDKNAILIKPSNKIRGYKSPSHPLNVRSKEFIEDIRKIDQRVIQDICKSLKKLIKNSKLREKLGKYGNQTIKKKFSLEIRNKKLKKIFDKAIK